MVSVYLRFSQAVESIRLDIDEFWESPELYADVETFKEFLPEDLLEFVSVQEIDMLINDLKDDEDLLFLPKLVQTIPYWKT